MKLSLSYKPALVMGGMILGLGHSILKHGKVNQSPFAEVVSKFLFMTEIARKYFHVADNSFKLHQSRAGKRLGYISGVTGTRWLIMMIV